MVLSVGLVLLLAGLVLVVLSVGLVLLLAGLVLVLLAGLVTVLAGGALGVADLVVSFKGDGEELDGHAVTFAPPVAPRC